MMRPGREVEASPGVHFGLGGAEEGLAEAESDRAGDDSKAQVEQIGDRRHRASDERARPGDGGPVRLGRGRPVAAAMAGPAASASRQPRAPQTHVRPSGSTIT